MSEGKSKRYSKKEIERIFKRAVDLQRKELHQAGGTGEISLNELESIGKEVGIDPELIRAAALELDSEAGAKQVSGFLGETPRYERRFSIQRNLSDRDFRRIINALARILDAPGAGTAEETGFVWSTDSLAAYQRGFRTIVSFSAMDEGGELRVTEDYTPLAGGLFGGIMGGFGLGGGLGIGLGVGIGALGSALFAALVPFGFVGAAYLLARGIFGLVVRSRRRKLAKIAENIKAEAERDPTKEGPQTAAKEIDGPRDEQDRP
jgi:hypothetical protein